MIALPNTNTSINAEADGATENETLTSSYAIRNVKTRKCVRPYRARTHTENPVILYPRHKWKCITWTFIPVEEHAYRLRNLYTEKTFQPQYVPAPKTPMWQQPLAEESGPVWEFLRQPDGQYEIRLQGTDLYLTISSESTNTPIVVDSHRGTSDQRWELIEQHPRH
ncbi:MAG: RICIN domain-containing protein [Ancrocorticia sp.]|nr:RICIN domain-containing protein [Ancrocorticia sp.]